jgi:hypothetical protein
MDIKEAIAGLKELKLCIIGRGKRIWIDREACEVIDTAVEELEKPTYSAQDMEAFAEWCDDLSLYYHSAVDNIWIKMGDEGERFTTAQLLELWKQERKEATE